MRLVVDANVIFAALLKDGATRRVLLLYTLNNLELYAPPTLITEVSKYKAYLARKAGITKEKLSGLFDEILSSADIQVSDKKHLVRCMKKAKNISPDPNDSPYFAVALEKRCNIWSNDRRLKEQNVVEVLNTAELLEILSSGQQ